MRTSHLQYLILVEFMERNGDLSKPSNNPRRRHYTQKWKALSDKLNSEGTGDSRSEEKWRKVWSDLKNNTKKWAKINQAASGTGGGSALHMSLSNLEHRAMQLMGVHAATRMVFAETSLQTQLEERPGTVMHTVEAVVEETAQEKVTEEWNLRGTSSQPTVLLPSTTATIATDTGNTEEHWTPPVSKKRRKVDDVAQLFVESDRNRKDYARQRDLV